MIAEIELEQERPRQQVRDILPNMPHDENELRGFLRLVVEY